MIFQALERPTAASCLEGWSDYAHALHNIKHLWLLYGLFYWEGLIVWKGKIITYSLLSLLVTKPIEVNGSVAIDLCGLSSGPVYATANWRGKSSMVKGKRSKGGELNTGEE